jgi:hypothetical protein
MTSDEYAAIAQSARVWQLDPALSPTRRRVARSLCDLAGQLTDPDYGCATETFAVTAMYRFLQRPEHRLT